MNNYRKNYRNKLISDFRKKQKEDIKRETKEEKIQRVTDSMGSNPNALKSEDRDRIAFEMYMYLDGLPRHHVEKILKYLLYNVHPYQKGLPVNHKAYKMTVEIPKYVLKIMEEYRNKNSK